MEANKVKELVELTSNEYVAYGRSVKDIAVIKRNAVNHAIKAIVQILQAIPCQELDLENDDYTNASVLDYEMAASNEDFPYVGIDKIYLNAINIACIELDDETKLPLYSVWSEDSFILDNRVTLSTLYELLGVMRDALKVKATEQ